MKRKLKHASARRPKDRMSFAELSKRISEETGYTAPDIKEVLRSAFSIIIEELMKNRAVVLPKFGMFYPWIRTARKAVSLKGGTAKPEVIDVDARWVARFRPGIYTAKKMMKNKPSQEEIDKLYDD